MFALIKDMTNMRAAHHVSILTFLLLSISGCGGGGSDSPAPTSPTTPPPSNPPPPQDLSDAQIIETAVERTTEELRTAARNLVNDNYNGLDEANMLSLPSSSYALTTLAGHKQVTAIESTIRHSLSQDLDELQTQTLNCFANGEINIQQSLSSDAQQPRVFDYANCVISSDFVIDGTIALTITDQNESMISLSAYFHDLTVTQDGITMQASGYMDVKLPLIVFNTVKTQKVYALIEDQDNAKHFVLDSDVQVVYEGVNPGIYDTQGRMQVDDFGVIDFELSDFYYEKLPNSPDSFAKQFVGYADFYSENRSLFDFEVSQQIIELVLYQQDSNDNGQFDEGAYYRDQSELFSEGIIKQLFPLDILSIPPLSPEPNIINPREIYTDTEILISTDSSSFDDPDTPLDQLNIQYQWYLNDVLLPDYTSDFLPAGIAVFGDTVSVLRVVSDATSSVVSPLSSVSIADSLPVLTLNNAPDSASPNQTITFNASFVDPDLADSSFLPDFFDGPEGATIDNGVVTWTVPESQLFASQYYNFSFDVDGDDINNVDKIHSIKVESDDTKDQVTKSFEYEINPQHVSAGDFNGDGSEELAFADEQNNIFIVKKDNDFFSVDWTNAFALQIPDTIQQIESADIDDDSQDELVIASRDGVFAVSPYKEGVTPLYMSEDAAIITLKILLIDNIPFLFVTTTAVGSPEYDLTMVNLLEQTEQLLSSGMERYPKLYAVGNIDLDANLELVLDSGLGIDLSTNNIDWESSVTNESIDLKVIDTNSDQVDEIILLSNDRELTVIHAQDNTQELIQLDYYVCMTEVADVVNDQSNELILVPCSGEFFTALELNSGSLSPVWTFSSDDNLSFGSRILEIAPIESSQYQTLVYHDGSDSYRFSTLPLRTGSQATTHDEFLQFREIRPLGWHTDSGVVDSAAFAIERFEETLFGQFLSTNENADQVLSPSFPVNPFTSPQPDIFDIDNDGIFEVPLTINSTISLLSVFDATEVFSYRDTDKFSNSTTLSAIDIDNDENLELMAFYSDGFMAIDHETNTPIAERSFPQLTGDKLPDNSGDTTYVYTIVPDGISVDRFQNGQFVDVDFVFADCYSLFLLNDDQDEQNELGCYEKLPNSEVVIQVFDVSSDGLLLKRSVETNLIILDIIADPSRNNEQGFFAKLLFQNDKNNTSSFYPVLGYLNRDGVLIYRSPPLIDSSSSDVLKARVYLDKLELLFGTENTAYWFKN